MYCFQVQPQNIRFDARKTKKKRSVLLLGEHKNGTHKNLRV